VGPARRSTARTPASPVADGTGSARA
jgi:hypothetical protein